MNEPPESENKSDLIFDAPLTENNETVMIPRGARRIKRLMSDARENERTTVNDVHSVTLVIRGMTQHVQFDSHNEAGVVLGRIDPLSGERPDIDLTPMGAAQRGVSRTHARLEFKEGFLWLTDLGSANGTYLSGRQLPPNEPTKLHKGDQFLLGRLAVEVNFE